MDAEEMAAEAKRIAARLFDLAEDAEDMAPLSRAIDRLAAAATREPPAPAVPIDMVLHCPVCGLQHIDEPEHEREEEIYLGDQVVDSVIVSWDNPPHRSHLCHGCGHIWRPADVLTNGVAAVKTKGKADSAVATQRQPIVPEGRKLDHIQEREVGLVDIGHRDEDGVFYEVVTVDTDNYNQPDAAMPIARAIVAALAAAPVASEGDSVVPPSKENA